MLIMKWYSSGLRFECVGCGNCCAGPQEGDIWISAAEIEMLAKHLAMPEDQVRERFIMRSGSRTGIIEDKITRDCVFLQTGADGKRGCSIYPVRPNQCRTWPFWNWNLASPRDWEEAAQRCPGIGRGPEFTLEEIESLRTQKQWWE
jgi:hypothetical protein